MSSKNRRHAARRDETADAFRFLSKDALAEHFDAPAAVSRWIAQLSTEDLLTQINAMPPAPRQFLLGTIGARAAQTANRAMAAQILARLRNGGSKARELMSVLCVPALAIFGHPLEKQEWYDLCGHDPVPAANVYTAHPDVFVFVSDLDTTASRAYANLALAAAIEADAPAAYVALGLLAEHDPQAAAACDALRAHQPDLPTVPNLRDLSPLGRARQLGADLGDNAEVPLGLLADLVASAPASRSGHQSHIDPHDGTADEGVADADDLVESGWDLARDLARAVADALETDRLPSEEDVEHLAHFTGTITAIAASLDATDRASLREALAALRQDGSVDAARRWLLRLVAMTGPDELGDDIAALAALADEAAHVTEHTRDEALLALLTLVDLSTEQRHGQPVDFRLMMSSRTVANAGLPEHEPVVFAAGAGMLTVPAPDDAADLNTDPAASTPSGQTEPPHSGEAADGTPSAPVLAPADDASARAREADEPAAEADEPEAPAPDELEPHPEPTPQQDPEPDPEPQAKPSEEPETAEVDLTSLPPALAKYLHRAPSPAAPVDRSDAGATPSDADPTDPDAVHEAAWGDPDVAALDAHLVAEGRYGLAADLATATGAPPAAVAARRLGAYADQLRNPTGVMAAQFSQHASLVDREELGDDRVGQLVAWAAAAKAAILAPSAGPAEVLADLAPCVTASPALTEVTSALIESSRSGVVVVAPEAVEAAGASSAAHARAKALAEQADEIATRAKHRTIKYIPANDIYNTWLAPDGALEPVLRAVRENDPSKAPVVRIQLIENLRGRADRNIDTVFRSQQQHKGPRPRIIAQPRQQLAARWDEIVELAANWVQVCDELAAQEAAERSGSWHTAAVNRLRHRINDDRADALRDLTAMTADAGIPEGSHGPAAALAQTFAACDGQLPVGEEPPTAFVEHGELLNLAVPLIATNLTAEPGTSITTADLTALASATPPSPTQTYDALAARAAHDLTGVLIAGLRAVDPDVAATLETRRTRDILATNAEVRAELTALREDIDLRRVAGVLGDDLWARASTQAESLTDPSRRDYERIRTAIARITAELDAERAGRVEHVLAQIQAHATEHAVVAEHQDHLARLAAAGQVASAEEQLQQVLEGAPIGSTANRVEHLTAFFPAVPDCLQGRNESLERINQALRTGEHTDVTRALAAAGLHLLDLTEARRKQARESFGAWRELASHAPVANGTTETDKLRIILRQAGIEFRTAHKETGNRDRQLLTLGGVDVLGKALTPTLGSERAPDQSMRVLLVRRAATPATIIEWMASQPKDRTVLVLWLARMPLTAAEWRAIAEAARGRSSNPAAVVMDSASLVYLAAQAEPRLSTLAAIALPFTATNPYKDTPGDTAPEMFYGRTEERAAILDLNGSSFVSGGRQLGKSALLRHAARTFNDASAAHVAIVMSIFRVGKRNDPEQVWNDLWPELAAHGITDGPVPDGDVASATHSAIRTWIAQDPARQLLLLLDEADDFLDADAHGNRFDNVEWFRRLMLETNRSVKVVLAGLHRTARFESLPNQPLPHLGKPIVVGPLRPQHARDLLTGPLAAIGYRFDSDITIAQVLAQANNMPAQLQLIGEALVDYMSARPLTGDAPPNVITSDDVTAAFTPKLREDLRSKFTLTLTLDPRYKVIAYVVAQAAHEHGSDASLSLGELSTECRNAWPEGFADLGADGFRGLVAECVDLGVLARDGNRYRLRTPSVRRLLGTEIEVFEELASASETLKVPATYDGSVYRRQIGKLENAISPLTERQLGSLIAERRSVVVVAGSPATGLDKVIPTIEEVVGTVQHGGTAHRCTNTRPEGIAAAISKAAGRSRLLVDARTANAKQLAEMLAAAEDATDRTHQDVTTVIVAGPASAATWTSHVNRLDLERIGKDGMRLLSGAEVLPFHEQRDQERVVTDLGGWPILVSDLTNLYRDGTRRPNPDALIEAVKDNLSARPGRLATSAGVPATPDAALTVALRHITELTATTPEDATSVAELLEVVDDPALASAMASGGYPSTHALVDALIALACLQSDGTGRWRTEPVLAADLGQATR